MVVDQITENPVAGSSFNVSGRVVSDNGSGLENRDGSTLISNVLFTIDDLPTGFAVSNGSVQSGGYWTAVITLTPGFERGTHVLEASLVPTVNFYLGSKNNSTFDSRGFSVITFLEPSLDALGQPSLNDRTERGTMLDVRIKLEDNLGQALAGQQVTFSLPATNTTDEVSISVNTYANGTANASLMVPFNASVGFSDVLVTYDGIAGTTGVSGYNTSTEFVTLAATNMTILEHTESLVAGQMLYVNGTLLDDLDMPLYVDGVASVAIVRLFVDGVPVARCRVMHLLVRTPSPILFQNRQLLAHIWSKFDSPVVEIGLILLELVMLLIQNSTCQVAQPLISMSAYQPKFS